jgi:hypothetical protein
MDDKKTNDEIIYGGKWEINLISNSYNDLLFISNRKFPKQKRRSFLNQEPIKTKYQRMEEISDVKGFVVNVHGPTDFDIDFNLSDDLIKKYNNVIFHKYVYKDVDVNYEFPKNNILSHSEEREGKAYRCRLRRIGLQKNNKSFMWKSNQLLTEIKHLIDRTDGWVRCNLLDIDVYQRLLIDIIIDTKNGSINLTDYLLNRMKSDDDPIFFEYVKA